MGYPDGIRRDAGGENCQVGSSARERQKKFCQRLEGGPSRIWVCEVSERVMKILV